MGSNLSISLQMTRDILNRYFVTTIFALGIVGSLLNIRLFTRPRLRANSCCSYFFVSSIAAFIFLSISGIPQFISMATPFSPMLTNNDFCKARFYINQLTMMSCRWLLTMACIDRCCSSSANANIRRVSTVYVARRVSLGICLAWLIIPIHSLIFVNILQPRRNACAITNTAVEIYHGIYTIVMGGTLPPIIMLVCITIIWKNLRSRAIRRSTIQNDSTKKSRDDQVLLILLAQVFIYLITNLPFTVNNLYAALTRDVTNKSANRLIIEAFVLLGAELFIFTFPASLFYSSTLASPLFRSELRKILGRCCFNRFADQNRIMPVNTIQTLHHRDQTGFNRGTMAPSLVYAQ